MLSDQTQLLSFLSVCQLFESYRIIYSGVFLSGAQGFFGPRVPVDNLDGGCVGVSYFGNKKLVNPGNIHRLFFVIIYKIIFDALCLPF